MNHTSTMRSSRRLSQAVGSPHVTAPGETRDTDQAQQAEQVQGEGIQEVEGAVQEFNAEVFLQPPP